MSETPIVYDPHKPVAYVGGQVIPIGKRAVTAAELVQGLQAAILMPYEGNDPKKQGLTKKEAMEVELTNQAADGNLSAMAMYLDRTLGKPLQQVQSLNVSASWKEFLDTLMANARDPKPPIEAVVETEEAPF
jgi:hypothetical protein